MNYDERPPWMRHLPDPDPATPSMMGGKLRETAPSIHEHVEGLGETHPIVRQDRRLMASIMRLFEAIVDGLPADTVVELAPADAIDPSVEEGAVRLLTKSKRWQSKTDDRTTFGWPYEDVYELSDTLRTRAQNACMSEEVRLAAQAAYQLFVRVAIFLADLYQHCWVDPSVVRRLRLRHTA